MRTSFPYSNSNQLGNQNIQGTPQRASFGSADLQAERDAFLRYASSGDPIVVSGNNDYGVITGLKDGISKLKTDYFSRTGTVIIKNQEREDLEKRFLLFEHELDGLLRRKIQYSGRDYQGGTRNLDFTTVLNEKQNQIVELEKKIQNLEQRLRRSTARQIELQNRISQLNAQILSLRDRSLTGQKLDFAIQLQNDNQRLIRQIDNLRSNFSSAASIWKNQIAQIRSIYPNDRFDFDSEVIGILQRLNVKTYNINGVQTIQVKSERTVQVPVMDVRTKGLIYLFARALRNLSVRYPQILNELDRRVVEFFQQEIIETVQVDQLDRLVEIVKYVPQTVRVENVYTYGSQSRRVQFHLRVLIKVLLQQLERLKFRTGAVLDLDQSIISMINHQIMGVVNVDDVLKVFRVVPKIVEVEKIIQKVCERVVEVPQVIPVQKVVEKVIQVPKIQQIQKITHVPVQIIKVVDNVVQKIIQVPIITERVVQVPKIIQKVVERIVQVPKIIEVEKIVQKVIVKTETVTVEVPVNKVIIQPQEVIVYQDKIVTIEKIVEKVVQVPVYVQKLVEKVIEIQKIKPIQVIRQVIVEVHKPVPYEKQTILFKDVPQPIQRIVEKIVVVQNIVQRIVQVPQVVEKIVQVMVQVPKLVEVQKIVQKLVPVVEIKEVERVNNVTVQLIRQVEKIIDRRVEVPIIEERIIQVPTTINQIVIERVEVPRIIQVERWNDKIITETKIIEVEKPIVHYIRDIQIVKAIVQKVVQVPRTIQRIKQVKVKVEKIVQKMVQIPKIVELEKVVQRLVVVPRIIERVIQVPQIVEVVVEKVIQKEIIKEVQVNNTIPVQVQKPIQIEVIKNVYIQIERPVQKIVQKIVPVQKIVREVEIVQNIIQKIITIKKQVVKEIVVQKVVPIIVQTQVLLQIEKPVTLIVQVPVQVQKIIEKPIAIPYIQEKIIQTPQIVQKIVSVINQTTKVQEVERVVQKIIEVQHTNVVNQIQYIVQEKIVQVPTEQQVVVVQTQTVREQTPIQLIVQKIVQIVVEVPKVVEIEKLVEKLIQKQQIVQLQTVVPQLVKITQIVKEFVDRFIPITVVQQVIKEVPVQVQKIVQVFTTNVEVKQVPTIRQNTVTVDRYKQYTNTVNHIEREVQIVDRYEQKQVPIYSTVEKIIQIPQILEKIVERIVVMPQIVEVLKYVHEISQTDGLGGALTGDVQVAETRYREAYGNAKRQLQILLVDLRRLRDSNPNFRSIIDTIERFLVDFDRLASAQRIVTVDREKIVERQVQKGVLVPVQNTRNELAMSLLVERLILQIKRIKKENPNIRLSLQDEIGLIFFTQLYDKQSFNLSGDFQSNLKRYTEQAISRFTKNGGKWTSDHELMINTMLSERFAMANAVKYANQQIEKAKSLAEVKGALLREKQTQFQALSLTVQDLHRSLIQLQNNGGISRNSSVSRYIDTLGSLINSTFTVHIGQPTRILGQFEGSGNDISRILSYLREKQAEVDELKSKLINVQKGGISTNYRGIDSQRTVIALRNQNSDLARQIQTLRNQQSQVGPDAKVRELQIKLKTANSRIQELQSLNRAKDLQSNISSSNISRVQSSNITSTNGVISSQYTTSRQGVGYGATVNQGPSYNTTSNTTTIQSGSNYQTSGVRTLSGGVGATSGTSVIYGRGSGASGNENSNGTTTLSGSRTGTGTTIISSSNRTTTTPQVTGTTIVSGSGSGATYGTSSSQLGQSGNLTTTTTAGVYTSSNYQRLGSGSLASGTEVTGTGTSGYTILTKKY